MKKKITAICLVVALAAIAVVGATLAYFTDDTDKVENTFSFGKVAIDLAETSDEKDGIVGTSTDGGFAYSNILPGLTYAKKPVITVDKDSLKAYVFAELTVENYNALYAALTSAELSTTAGGLDGLLVSADLGNVVDAWMEGNVFHIVYSKGTMEAKDTWTLFTGVAIPSEFEDNDIADLGTVKFDIKGYAVQADGIADVKAAWAEVDPYTEPEVVE